MLDAMGAPRQIETILKPLTARFGLLRFVGSEPGRASERPCAGGLSPRTRLVIRCPRSGQASRGAVGELEPRQPRIGEEGRRQSLDDRVPDGIRRGSAA